MQAVHHIFRLLVDVTLHAIGIPALNKWSTMHVALRHLAFLSNFHALLERAESRVNVQDDSDSGAEDEQFDSTHDFYRERRRFAKRGALWLARPYTKAEEVVFLLLMEPCMVLHYQLFKAKMHTRRKQQIGSQPLLFDLGNYEHSPAVQAWRRLAKLGKTSFEWKLVT